MRLEELKGSWSEELTEGLWSYRTTVRGSTNETPFSLAFGSKTVVPVEIGLPTERVERPFDEPSNDEALLLNLDLLEKKCESAQLRTIEYQNRVARYYNSRIKHQSFMVDDLGLWKVLQHLVLDPT